MRDSDQFIFIASVCCTLLFICAAVLGLHGRTEREARETGAEHAAKSVLFEADLALWNAEQWDCNR